MLQNQLIEMSNQAKKEGWPYPKVFKAMKDLGLVNYSVDFSPFVITYTGLNEEFTEIHEEHQLEVSDTFNKEEVEKAIKIHQAQKSTYAELLRDLAANGVAGYYVNMSTGKIDYKGKKTEGIYTEFVPQQ